MSAMPRRRPVPPPSGNPSPDPPTALAFTSGLGEVWYLHEGVTKTGKPRYFVARNPGVGGLSALPEGWEFRESVNGVVSVARAVPGAGKIPPEDIAVIQTELKRHDHLARYKVAEAQGALVVYEPQGLGSLDRQGIAGIFRLDVSALDSMPSGRVRYFPVLKFTPGPNPKSWSASRWVFRGEGWWHWLGHGSLATLAKNYLPAVGTDDFFELL